jgi:hypothetical protein
MCVVNAQEQSMANCAYPAYQSYLQQPGPPSFSEADLLAGVDLITGCGFVHVTTHSPKQLLRRRVRPFRLWRSNHSSCLHPLVPHS